MAPYYIVILTYIILELRLEFKWLKNLKNGLFCEHYYIGGNVLSSRDLVETLLYKNSILCSLEKLIVRKLFKTLRNALKNFKNV